MCNQQRQVRAEEDLARRVARTAGYIARKSRRRAGTVDNFGGFMLIDAYYNFVVAGSRFELTPADVIDLCQ